MSEQVPVYRWGEWPSHLLTKKQMNEAGFQIGKNLPSPAGMVYRKKSPDSIMWLYDRAQGVPKKVISPEARKTLAAAAEKSRQGWYCTRCGQPHGESYRGRWRAYKLSPPGLCVRCEDRDSAAEWARGLLAGEFVILDTETTGLESTDEIVQIAVINQSGETLLDTYINPRNPDRLIEKRNGISAHDINGISPYMLADAPTWPIVYERLVQVIAGKRIIIYNAQFDEGMIQNNCNQHGIQCDVSGTECAMLMYAQWYGDYSDYWGDYRWQRLNGGHTALSDCLECLKAIKDMAGFND